ncbi:4-hydroxybenzoate polyprenyltransferase [Candidatus Magnetoovum chiemensis]|nr:4-hydroxybenzoate polyprenyltransferase [Candidatus Magnetoovum chiemensis]
MCVKKTLLLIINTLAAYLRMIKFSHSVFALPFAATAALLAANGLPTALQIIWITAAMLCARTSAMGMNRIIDRKIDLANPRTKNRELPSNIIKVRDALILTIMSSIGLIFCAYMLNSLCFMLSPLALTVFFLYSYTKRFTWLSHIVLGTAIALAPIGAWIAINEGAQIIKIFPLALAVLFWLAGFDVLYALMDLEFDKTYGLYSIAQTFGIKKAITIARTFQSIKEGAFFLKEKEDEWTLLIITGKVFALGAIYYFGIIIVTGFLIYEHSIVSDKDLSKINFAFFNMNGYISITIFVFVLIEKVII